MQQFLKPAAGTARAWVVTAELFEKLLVAVHDALAAFDARLGREAFATLTRGLETRRRRGVRDALSWHTSTL
jgi:hypothetical protein